MYLLGHIGLALLANHFSERFFRYKLSILEYIILAISALIPDLLDKPIGIIFFDTGRWVGHSLLFLILVSLLIYRLNFDSMVHFIENNDFVTRLNKGGKSTRVRKLIIAGIALHLVGDITTLSQIVILWPILGSFPVSSSDVGFLYGFSDPFTRMGEIIGLLTLIYINYSNGWSKRGIITITIFVLVYTCIFIFAYLLLVDN